MKGVDTSVIVDAFSGKKDASELLHSFKERLFISEIVIYEFLRGNITEEERVTFFSFVDNCNSLSFDRKASVKSAKIYRDLKRQGKAKPSVDVAIAGTYLVNEVETILTGNPKDFEGTGLKVKTY